MHQFLSNLQDLIFNKNRRPVKTRYVLYKSADQVKTEPYESKVKNARTKPNKSKVKVQDPPLYKT